MEHSIEDVPVQGTYIGHVAHWVADSSLGISSDATFVHPDNVDEANIVTSLVYPDWIAERGNRRHKVLLDLDVPAQLIPSSTPGNSHLYIDVEVPEEVYMRLIEVMAEAGILQPGYVSASRYRGYTALRFPWVKKDGAEND